MKEDERKVFVDLFIWSSVYERDIARDMVW